MMTTTNDWHEFIASEKKQDYFISLEKFLTSEYEHKIIYPKKNEIFKAFDLTSYNDTKVLILGQDPYHGENQAHGLCFSVTKDTKIPPSLRNIYKTLANDCGCEIPTHGNLSKWANQGILLLNAVLTVRAGQAASHQKKGWEIFTDHVISHLNKRNEPIVFLLWGAYAHNKEKLITNQQHLILKSVHPSPLSARRGFFECQHFSKTNMFLQQHYGMTIDWQID